MRVRRLRKDPAHLEITAFINLIVVLVPFLLSTAVFTRLAVLDLKLPGQQSAVEQLSVNNLQLEVVVRKDVIEVRDRIGGDFVVPILRRKDAQGHALDVKDLSAALVVIKKNFPDKSEASLLAEPETPYDDIVQVMDAMRSTVTAQGTKLMRAELFPNVSIGDAPVLGQGRAPGKAGTP